MFCQAYRGKVHICLDGWTSPNVISFLGVTLHRVVKARIQTLILDFIKYVYSSLEQSAVPNQRFDRLTQAHEGEYLARKLEECLKEYNIDTKVFSPILSMSVRCQCANKARRTAAGSNH